jgi:predicted esterase
MTESNRTIVGTMVNLQIQEDQSDTCHNDENVTWSSLGQIRLLPDEIQETHHLPCSDDPTNGSQVVPQQQQQQKQQQKKKIQERKQLPISIKNILILSMYHDSRTDVSRSRVRKQSYLFRHAPSGQQNTNLLILLHGAGDTHIPFDKFAQSIKLPQTATLALSAMGPIGGECLPFQLGYTWFQEMEYTTGTRLVDSQIQSNRIHAAEKVCNVLHAMIVQEGWIYPEQVFFFGYGTGAALAMQVCCMWSSFQGIQIPLGGAICVGGGIEVSAFTTSHPQNAKTPVLLMVGGKDESFPPTQAISLQRQSATSNIDIDIYIEPDKGQSMVQSKAEIQKIMEFFSRRLVRISSFGIH